MDDFDRLAYVLFIAGLWIVGPLLGWAIARGGSLKKCEEKPVTCCRQCLTLSDSMHRASDCTCGAPERGIQS